MANRRARDGGGAKEIYGVGRGAGCETDDHKGHEGALRKTARPTCSDCTFIRKPVGRQSIVSRSYGVLTLKKLRSEKPADASSFSSTSLRETFEKTASILYFPARNASSATTEKSRR